MRVIEPHHEYARIRLFRGSGHREAHAESCIGARVSGWSSARSRSAATRVAAEFRIRAQVRPSLDTRRLSFMVKLTGFFDRNPALDVPALGGQCCVKAS
jgi:hypothetical protein